MLEFRWVPLGSVGPTWILGPFGKLNHKSSPDDLHTPVTKKMMSTLKAEKKGAASEKAEKAEKAAEQVKELGEDEDLYKWTSADEISFSAFSVAYDAKQKIHP